MPWAIRCPSSYSHKGVTDVPPSFPQADQHVSDTLGKASQTLIVDLDRMLAPLFKYPNTHARLAIVCSPYLLVLRTYCLLLLLQVGLTEKVHSFPHQLSGGMQRQVALNPNPWRHAEASGPQP